MTFIQMRRALAVLVASVALSACAHERRPYTLAACDVMLANPPKVIKKGLTGATLSIPFKVKNPNEIAICLDRMDLDATINGSSIGTQRCTPRANIGPGRTVEVSVHYDVSYVAAGIGVLESLAAKNGTFEVKGSATEVCADGNFAAEPLEFPLQAK